LDLDVCSVRERYLIRERDALIHQNRGDLRLDSTIQLVIAAHGDNGLSIIVIARADSRRLDECQQEQQQTEQRRVHRARMILSQGNETINCNNWFKKDVHD
jgi:bifunctional DNA-binding transcriptional regulator/antitoxin component of YhaV-PrlF toxin-antitoxin module